MAQRKSVADDLDLSLTGSHISAQSSVRRPSSAGQMKRMNAAADVRSAKSDKNTVASTSAKHNGMSRKAPNTPTSHRSAASAASHTARKSSRQADNDSGDFLALFESSVQPQIRRPGSTVSSSGGRGKKPAPNAVKLPWPDTPPDRGLNLRGAAAASSRNIGGVVPPSSDRSEGPHNIFRPDSALSDDDDDELDDIEESLSQSINKLQSLQSQLSGINKNNSEQPPPPLPLTPPHLNSQRSADATPRNDSSRSGSRGGSAAPTPRNLLTGTSPRNRSAEGASSDLGVRDFASKNLATAATNDLQRNGLANNMTSQGHKQKAKASLSSMENSYQNIKHKTPVNQVRRLPSPAAAAAAQVNQTAAEEYLHTLNGAATRIQRWFRRHLVRQQAGHAAMRRLMQQKREQRAEVLRQSTSLQDQEDRRQEDRKRANEDKARQARQDAIQELHKKRDERRQEVKRKAEEEVKFLQASGKITKAPAGTTSGARKKTTPTPARPGSAPTRSDVAKEGVTPRGEDQGAATGAVSGVGASLNDFLQAAAAGGEGAERESGGGEGGSPTQTGTRTTLNDLYDTLRKLEEEEHFATQRSQKKHSWLDRLEKDGSNLCVSCGAVDRLEKDGSNLCVFHVVQWTGLRRTVQTFVCFMWRSGPAGEGRFKPLCVSCGAVDRLEKDGSNLCVFHVWRSGPAGEGRFKPLCVSCGAVEWLEKDGSNLLCVLCGAVDRLEKGDEVDRLEKGDEGEDGSNLTAENLEKLNGSKEGLGKGGGGSSLTDDKLKSIMSFLDEVHVSDRLSEIDSEILRMNEELERPAVLVPSGEEVAQLEKAQATASEVTHTVLSQRLEIDEKARTVTMLQKALNQQRELTVRHARDADKEMKKRLDVQKDEYEEAIKRHLGFIDQLIDDKKGLGEKCEQLVKELKTVDHKYQEKIKSMGDSHTVEMTKLKEVHLAAEKLRREKWIEEKTKKIKDMTVKGLEPEIQRLIARHKGELRKVRQVHEAELLEADERAAQRYVKMTEELRDTLAQEREAALARERDLGKERYEKQLQQEEDAFQQQRRRLYSEVQEEKDRLAHNAARQRQELDGLRRQLEDAHRSAIAAVKDQFTKAREEQDRRHTTEVRELQERLQLEKEAWEENYKKKHDTWLMQKERELKEQVRKERDKEIELGGQPKGLRNQAEVSRLPLPSFLVL
ncbi:hypothetical protein ACOMHN_054423 [Nucella lapillus]